jgi:hypothetical protein
LKKAEIIVIAVLAVTLVFTVYLLFKQEPSKEPVIITPPPIVEQEATPPVVKDENAQ